MTNTVVYISFKLAQERLHVADVVHPLVETARELRSYCLNRDSLICKRTENHRELGRTLGGLGFIHGHFRHEVISLPERANTAVGPCSFPDGKEIAAGRCSQRRQLGPGRQGRAVEKVAMSLQECLHRIRICRLADEIRNIDCEEVTERREPVNARRVDVVRIDVVRPVPVSLPDCILSGGPLV